MSGLSRRPVLVTAGLIVVLLLILTFDVFHSATRYLYFSTEIGIFLVAMLVYFPALQGIRWRDPPEKGDEAPRPGWKAFAGDLLAGFAALALVLALVWAVQAYLAGEAFAAWLRRGSWYLYYIGVFGVSLLIIRRHLKHVHRTALMTATLVMVYFLSTYEMLLVDRGTGWTYNRTVIGQLLNVPIDNILFIYPVAPALSMVFYSVLTRRLNDLKAFWLLNLVLAPCSVIVELIGIYPLNLWEIYNGKSVWPMGQTNLEEFLYYFLFQFFSVIIYVYFSRQFKETPATAVR